MEEYNTGSRSRSINPKIYLFLSIFLVLPGFLLGYLYHFIFFRTLRQKPLMLNLGWLFISFILFIVIRVVSPFSNIVFTKEGLITPYIFICLIASVLIGLFLAWWHPRQLKLYPELTKTKGWAYGFEYNDTIFEILKRKKLSEQLRAGELYDLDKAPLGILEEPALISEDGSGNSVFFNKVALVDSYYSEAIKHTLATGMTGSGKTVSLLNKVANDFATGRTICVVDFKKSQDWIYYLSKKAKEYNRPFYHFVSGKQGLYNNPYCDYQSSYDPLAKGSITSKADMVLNMRTWDGAAEIYKKQTQTLLVSIFYLLENVNKEETAHIIPWYKGGLAQFVAALSVNNLTQLIAQLDKDLQRKEALGIEISESDYDKKAQLKTLYETLTTRGNALKDQIDNLVANCRTLIMSDYGDWLAKGQTPNHIDLVELATSTSENKPVILFSFNPLEESEFAKIMGSLIMSDLSRTANYKNEHKETSPFGLYVDEFQILDPRTVKDLLEKSRSSGFYITLSLQSLDQLVVSSAVNGEAVKQSILDTVQNFIVHAGATDKAAKDYSGIIGDRKVINYKYFNKIGSGILDSNWLSSRDNTVTTSLDTEWVIPPEKFQSLSSPDKNNGYKATAYYITKSCSDKDFAKANRTVARKVHVIAAEEITKGVPDEFIQQLNTPREIPLLWEHRIIRKNQVDYFDNNYETEENIAFLEDLENSYNDEPVVMNVTQDTNDDLLAGLGEFGLTKKKKQTSFSKMKR